MVVRKILLLLTGAGLLLAAQTLAPDRFEYPPQTSIKALFMVGDNGDLCMSYSAKGVLTVYTGCNVALRPITRVIVKPLRPSDR